MPKIKQHAPMSLRLSPQLDKRLEEMAKRTGIKKHTLAQMAVEAAVEAIEQNNYRIVAPVKFSVTHVPAAHNVVQYPETEPQADLAAEESPKYKAKKKSS